jgi:hypothetical protein
MTVRQTGDLAPELLREIAEAVCSLEFGTVQITVHNSHVVQIDTVERRRIAVPADLSSGRSPTTAPTGDRSSGASRHVRGH